MQVLYKSTRGKEQAVTASMAILKGLSEDGGLFVPERIPQLDVPMDKLCLLYTSNVLTALYQPFWFSVALSVLALFFYLFAYHNETGGRGLKAAFSVWWKYFREDLFFRKLFFLTFYTTMILFRTLLNRDMWMNPLSDVFGNWWIWKYAEDGSRQLTTECLSLIHI